MSHHDNIEYTDDRDKGLAAPVHLEGEKLVDQDGFPVAVNAVESGQPKEILILQGRFGTTAVDDSDVHLVRFYIELVLSSHSYHFTDRQDLLDHR